MYKISYRASVQGVQNGAGRSSSVGGSGGARGGAWGHGAMPEHTDPRIVRTAQALEQAIVELASERPVSQITVAELADRAGVTRATFYNRCSSPLELLIQVLFADLELSQRLKEARRAE